MDSPANTSSKDLRKVQLKFFESRLEDSLDKRLSQLTELWDENESNRQKTQRNELPDTASWVNFQVAIELKLLLKKSEKDLNGRVEKEPALKDRLEKTRKVIKAVESFHQAMLKKKVHPNYTRLHNLMKESVNKILKESEVTLMAGK